MISVILEKVKVSRMESSGVMGNVNMMARDGSEELGGGRAI